MSYQRVYGTTDRPIDVLVEVRTGTSSSSRLARPVDGVPGYNMYYLNVMAGPGAEQRGGSPTAGPPGSGDLGLAGRRSAPARQLTSLGRAHQDGVVSIARPGTTAAIATPPGRGRSRLCAPGDLYAIDPRSICARDRHPAATVSRRAFVVDGHRPRRSGCDRASQVAIRAGVALSIDYIL
jgi:hypothetical protein